MEKKHLAKAGSLKDAFICVSLDENGSVVVYQEKGVECKTFYPKTFSEMEEIIEETGMDEDQVLHIYKIITRRFLFPSKIIKIDYAERIKKGRK